jgi:hypothetical protein
MTTPRSFRDQVLTYTKPASRTKDLAARYRYLRHRLAEISRALDTPPAMHAARLRRQRAAARREMAQFRALLPANLGEIADRRRIGMPTLDRGDPLHRLAAEIGQCHATWRREPA